MAQAADCEQIRAVMMGALDYNDEEKVIAILISLLGSCRLVAPGDFEPCSRIDGDPSLEKHNLAVAKIAIALSAIPLYQLSYITEINKNREPYFQLKELRERRLGDLVKIECELNIPEYWKQSFFSKVKDLLQYQKELESMNLKKIYID